MKYTQTSTKLLGAILLAFFGQTSYAEIIEGINVPAGQTLTIDAADTVVGGGFLDGTLNNYGYIDTDYNPIYPNVESLIFMNLYSVLNNHGEIYIGSEGAFSLTGGQKIVNHPDGLIVMAGYIDVYSGTQTAFENAGTLIVTRPGAYKSELYPNDTTPFTWAFFGILKNTGTMLLDRNNGQNICILGGRTFSLVNEGHLVIGNGTECNFALEQNSKARLIQNNGETKVNGTLGVHELTINKGVLSGSGNLIGRFTRHLRDVTISPGDPVGTLSITPPPEQNYVFCIKCTVAIDLAGAESSDRLHIDGDLYLSGWTLNVQLRDGYIPSPGTSFVIATANSIDDFNTPIYNLPVLPDNRTWSIQNTGTELVLIAN